MSTKSINPDKPIKSQIANPPTEMMYICIYSVDDCGSVHRSLFISAVIVAVATITATVAGVSIYRCFIPF